MKIIHRINLVATLKFVSGIAMLVAIGWLAWELTKLFFVLIKTIEPTVSVAIIGGMATFLSAVLAVLINQNKSRQKAIDEENRRSKIKVYRKLIFLLVNKEGEKTVLKHFLDVDPMPEGHSFGDMMMEIKIELVLYGSPSIINALEKFQDDTASNNEILMAFNQILLAIRRDLGMDITSLGELQCIRFLMSPEEKTEFLKATPSQ